MASVHKMAPEFKPGAIGRLFVESGFTEVFSPGDLVALKLHVGEPVNRTFIKPEYVREVVDAVQGAGGKPFLTDSTTLYRRGRFNAVDHLLTAWSNGFTSEAVGAPFVVSDGLTGESGVEVEVRDSLLLDSIEVAQAVYEADALIALTHSTGHISAVYGGAIKNLGMGCVTKNGKRAVHYPGVPIVDEQKCVACGACAKLCPHKVIEVIGHAVVDRSWCVACGRCVDACPNGALARGDTWQEDFLAALVDSAKAVLSTFSRDRVGFMNFLVDVTEGCDCVTQTPLLMPDKGVLASKDIVSIEQASLDLIEVLDAGLQVDYAEKAGLRSREYSTVDVT